MLNKKIETLQEDYSETEVNIRYLKDQNQKLEKRLDILSSIIDISKYINANVSDENLLPMINDVIIGILGVSYSTIYFKDKDDSIEVKATNIDNKAYDFYNKLFTGLQSGETFLINSRKSIFENTINIKSVVGVPIYLMDNYKGFIIVEHSLYNFFDYEQIKFISLIASQIGIAIENAMLYKKIKENSIKDPLLSIYNRRYFFELVGSIIKENNSLKHAIVMMDIDDFKGINDIYGHQFGDEVLIETCKIIVDNLDGKDIIARYGGEEIVIFIFDGFSEEKVFKKIDNIRKKIMYNSVKRGNIKSNITVSFGISYFFADENVNDVVGYADNALYFAKGSGKNKVVCA